jgi:hypothetical protein
LKPIPSIFFDGSRRRIAEDSVSQDRVSAYFANITKTPAVLEPLQIDLFGNIHNWPDHFFGDEMEDITRQSKAALQKRIRMNSSQEGA